MCISLTPTHPSFHFEPLQFANKYLAGLARFAVDHLPFFIPFKGSVRVHRKWNRYQENETQRVGQGYLCSSFCNL